MTLARASAALVLATLAARCDDASSNRCPSSPPDGACAASTSLLCTYGDAVDFNCRPIFACVSQYWMLAATPAPCSTDAGRIACPAQPAAGEGTACDNLRQLCAYADGTVCYCIDCIGGNADGGACSTALHFHCIAPPTDPSCPVALPNRGAPCAREQQACTWGSGCDAYQATCTNGQWQFVAIECQ